MSENARNWVMPEAVAYFVAFRSAKAAPLSRRNYKEFQELKQFGTLVGKFGWDVSKLNPRNAKILSAVAEADAVDLDIAWQEWRVAQAARQAVFDLFAVRQQITKLKEA